MGGKPTPAIGFAGGIERLLLALDAEKITISEPLRPDYYVVAMGESAREWIIPYINKIRLAGLYVEFDPDKQSFKAQLKAADGSGARYAMIIGEDEMKAGKVMLKDLSSGTQELISPEDIASR